MVISESSKIAEREKWNIPDWKNSLAYVYTEHYSTSPLINDQLRWEFLRRNKEYRAKWNDGEFHRTVFNLIEPVNPSLRADELGGKNILFVDSVFKGSPLSYAAPRCNSPDEFAKKFGEFVLQAEQDGYLIMGFDPSSPPTPQLHRAEEILTFYNKKYKESGEEFTAKECQIEKPSWLLRTLDAHNEGASLKEIGEQIYGYSGEDKFKIKSTARDRLIAASSYWKRVTPSKGNVQI